MPDPLPESLAPFSEIIRQDVTLAPYTWLKVGGPAQFLAEPRSEDELTGLVSACVGNEIPVRLLGGGSNLLVRDDGVPGMVIRLTHDLFSQVEIDGDDVVAGAGAALSHVVTQAVAAGLGGAEALVGIPGTVGGAVRGNAGTRSGEVGDFIASVDVLTATGERHTRTADQLSFEYRKSSVNELVILGARFHFKPEPADVVSARMRKLWIVKKESQPFSFQSAGCIFRNPRGLSAGALIEKAGLKGVSVGKVTVSERHANFLVTEEGATAAQVFQLIDMVRDRVRDAEGVELEPEVAVW